MRAVVIVGGAIAALASIGVVVFQELAVEPSEERVVAQETPVADRSEPSTSAPAAPLHSAPASTREGSKTPNAEKPADAAPSRERSALGRRVTLDGRVLAADTLAPLAGIKVRVIDEDVKDFVLEAQSGPDGEFQVFYLRPRHRYRVAVGEQQSCLHAEVVTFPTGGVQRLELRVPPPITIRGQVVDSETHAGIADATISFDFDRSVGEVRAISARDGSFVAVGALPVDGNLRISVEAGPQYFEMMHHLSDGIWVGRAVTLETVATCALEGRVVDVAGAPVGGIRLRQSWKKSHGSSDGWVKPECMTRTESHDCECLYRTDEAWTNDDGRFLLSNFVHGGGAEVRLSHRDGRKYLLSAPRFERCGDIATCSVVLPSESTRIEGRVKVNGAAERCKIEWAGKVLQGTVYANERGEFAIEGVESGRIELRAQSMFGGSIRKIVEVPPDETVHLDIDIPSAFVLRAEVRDRNDRPVAGQALWITAVFAFGDLSPGTTSSGETTNAQLPEPMVRTTTDANGQVELEMPFLPLGYYVEIADREPRTFAALDTRIGTVLDGETRVILRVD